VGVQRVAQILRSGDWLASERLRLAAVALLLASVVGVLYLVLTAHNGVDLQGRPLGTDFSNVYAAGTYVRDGAPQVPFDPVQQFARERTIFGDGTQFYGWHYPPYFLFVAAALALMPYGLALAVWQAVTLGLYLWMMRGIVRPASLEPQITGRDWLLLAVAFPAVLINVGHGQNGFLTAALLGGALTVLDRRPLLAGILFGLLAYKPQYGLMIPVALAAGGYWRAIAAAAAAVVIFTLATTLAFGTQVWPAFLASTEFTRTVVLEHGDTGWYKIQSVFSWARMWGSPIPLAYVIQGAVTIVVGAATVWLWRSPARFPLKAAALCLAAVLATPYTLDYDMMVLAPAIAFVAVDGITRGFAPWEKTALAALWLVPLLARSVAEATFIPLGVPAMMTMFVLIMLRPRHAAAPSVAFSRQSATIGLGPGEAEGGHDIAAFNS
jgi:hypothetical protein